MRHYYGWIFIQTFAFPHKIRRLQRLSRTLGKLYQNTRIFLFAEIRFLQLHAALYLHSHSFSQVGF